MAEQLPPAPPHPIRLVDLRRMRDLLAYCARYQAQTYAYVLLVTGRYPSFSDD